jgi:hypothetical protein
MHTHVLNWSQLVLFVFSREVFVCVSVLMLISLAVFNWKTQWKIAVTTTAVAVVVVAADAANVSSNNSHLVVLFKAL